MNKTFRILWFEDVKRWYEEEAKNVKRMVEAHFLNPEIEWHLGKKRPEDYSYSNSYDLILVDYQLESSHGDELIRQIRTNQVVTDVLFYSANIHDLFESMAGEENYLDGVYVCDRERTEFETKVDSLIEKVVRRSEDIVNLRGFVLDSTSEFESRIESVLNQYWEKADEAQQNILRNKLTQYYDKKHENLANRSLDVKDADSFSFRSHNERHDILGIQDRMRLLNACKEIINDIGLDSAKNIVKYYDENINSYRNGLGHAPCGGTTIIVNGNELSIDKELFELLRRNVQDMDGILRGIESNLKSFNARSDSHNAR